MVAAARSSPPHKEEQQPEAPSSAAQERRARWKYKGSLEKKVGETSCEIHTWHVGFATNGQKFGLVLDSDDKDAHFFLSRSAEAFGFGELAGARYKNLSIFKGGVGTEEDVEAQKRRLSRLQKISARMDESRTGYAAESATARRVFDKHQRRRAEETASRERQNLKSSILNEKAKLFLGERFPKLNLAADAVPQEECAKSCVNQATLYISGTTQKMNWIHAAAAAAARHTRVRCGTGCSTHFSPPGTVSFGGCFVGPLALVAESALLFAKVVSAARRHLLEARPARSVDGAAIMEGYVSGWAASSKKEDAEQEEAASPAREAAWRTIADASAVAANAWFGWKAGARLDSGHTTRRGYDAAFGAGTAMAEEAKRLRRAAVAPRSLLI